MVDYGLPMGASRVRHSKMKRRTLSLQECDAQLMMADKALEVLDGRLGLPDARLHGCMAWQLHVPDNCMALAEPSEA